MRRFCICTLLGAILFTPSLGSGFNQVETEHYIVVFQSGNEYWAHKVIEVAEDVWDDLMAAYPIQHDYKRIYIYVEDMGDMANGFAIPSHNRVTVSTTHLDFSIRSSDNWIRNVVTHELAHIFSIKAANKDRFFKFFTLQTYSRFQNPDWNAAFTYRDLLAPIWWLEGIAQYEAYRNGNDMWDTHRDMFLRMATLEDELLNYVQMSTFDNKHGFYPEMTYNQGYSMMLYIDSVYGEESVREIARSKSYIHFNQSLRKSCGASGRQLYSGWKKHLKDRYGAVADSVRKSGIREGELLVDEGYWDFYGSWSHDGRYVAFISNSGYDIMYPNLYLMDTETGKLKRVRTKRLQYAGKVDAPAAGMRGMQPLTRGSTRLSPAALTATRIDTRLMGDLPIVSSRVQWFHDGNRICYSRMSEGNRYADVYMYDLEKERETQLTWHARAKDPAPSPDGKTLAYINNDGGIQNLVLVDSNGKNTRFLTNFNNGTQLYAPCWTPDGKKIVVGIMHGKNRDIAVVSTDATPFDRWRKLTDTTFFADSLNFQEDLNLMLMVHTAADERDPCLSPDGKYLYFASDRTGIFNIYRMSLESWKVEQVTNVLGGAFSPSIHRDGKTLLYTGFGAANYNLMKLDITSPARVSMEWVRRDFSKRHTDPYIFSMDPGNGRYRKGKYKPRFTLWHFGPFLSFQPAFVTDSIGSFHMRTGLDAAAGELHGFASMGGSVYLGKDFSDAAGPSWGGVAYLNLAMPSIFGENRDLLPQAQAFIMRDVVRTEERYEPLPTSQLVETLPIDTPFCFNDTLEAFYSDFADGSFRADYIYNRYGVSGVLPINRYNQLNFQYVRIHDYIDGSLFDSQWYGRKRLLRIQNRSYDDAVDITDDFLQEAHDSTGIPMDSLRELFGSEYTDTVKVDLQALFDHFTSYKDHELSVAYQLMNVRPSFTIPHRADYLALSTHFIKSTVAFETFYPALDTLLELGEANNAMVALDEEGNQIPIYTPMYESKDYFRCEVFGLERFPLPGNNLLRSLPLPFGGKHFVTTNAFFGSLNRSLSERTNSYPLIYRIAYFLKAYPFRFDPVEPETRQEYFPVFTPRGIDSVGYTEIVDTSERDILWGNSIMYYNFEYTIELLKDLTIKPFGLNIKGLYLTPFFETASVWNCNWRDFSPRQILPLGTSDGKIVWREEFLRDAGIRVDLPFVIFDTWQGFFSFTWARRLDLDDAIVAIQPNGDLIGLDKNRYRFSVNLW